MSNGRGCFYCRRSEENPAWKPRTSELRSCCSVGLDPARIGEGPEAVLACPQGDVQFGFQIGGYYRRMWFDGSPPKYMPGMGGRIGGCLEWHIQGDAEFPQGENMEFHLCDWAQIERWVTFWGEELRRRGWVVDESDEG